MTLLTMAKRVARETDEDSITSVEGTIDDYVQKIVDWLNEGYKLAWESTFKNQKAETSGTWTVTTSPYDVSSKGIDEITLLYITGSNPITLYNSFGEFRRNHPDTTTEGQPIFGTLHQQKLYLYPKPDQSYTLNYFAKASFAVIDENADVSLIDESVLINYAKYKQLSNDGDPRADRAYIDFDNCLRTFQNKANKRIGLPMAIQSEDEYYNQCLKDYKYL